MSRFTPEEKLNPINECIKIPRRLRTDDGRSFDILEWNPHVAVGDKRIVITVKIAINPHTGARRLQEDNP